MLIMTRYDELVALIESQQKGKENTAVLSVFEIKKGE